MMYTSQEGELYLGQARALGAVGVLPKQIKPTDVSKVLYQLHLVPDRRSSEQSTFTPVNVAVEAGEPGLPANAKALTDTALREHFAELRRALVAGVDTQTDRITAEVRALLLEALPPPPAEDAPPPPRPLTPPWAWIVACAALAIALLSSALWWRSVQLLEDMDAQLTQLRQRQATPFAATAVAPAGTPEAPRAPGATRSALPTDNKPIVVPVPYGADALGGARLETIRQLLYRLAKQKVAGVADIKTFAGRFCLVGNTVDGYSPAPDETPLAKCDIVGNPSEEALSPTQRIPLGLANLIGDIRASTHGALDAQVSVGDPASVLSPYPPAGSEVNAGDWNRAASANNRVEIRVR
jgi:hypothetical protein